MDAQSPLTGNLVAQPIARYSSTQLVNDWAAIFGLDIAEELSGVSEVRKYQCPDSGVFFFAPAIAQGSGALYQALCKFPWYYAAAKWEYQHCLEALPPEQKLLEIGCGAGHFLELAQARGHDVYGLDINPDAVRAAKEKGLSADCEDLSDYVKHCDEQYDCVCSFQLLEHLLDVRSFLDNAVKLLKPGGLLILATPNAESFLRYQYTLLDMPPHHMTQWSLPAYRYLERILPLNLKLASYEPLAAEHFVEYARATSIYLSKRYGFGSKLIRSLVRKVIQFAGRLGLRRYFRGQCMLVVFEKEIDSAERSPEVDPRYANVGCGSTMHEVWENYDLVPCDDRVKTMDILQGWSLASQGYDVIYSSHVLEHLQRNQARRFLLNCYNSLRPGGLLRLVVPDLEGICREYLNQLDARRAGDVSAPRKHQWMTLELLDQMVRTRSGGAMSQLWSSGDLPETDYIVERVGHDAGAWIEQLKRKREEDVQAPSYEALYGQLAENAGERAQRFRDGGEVHQWMYDEMSLVALLESLGFTSIQRRGGADSDMANFKDYQLDTDAGGELRKPDSLFMECRRSV
ncbi:methyltransferase domain-containing protein [Puniceicoccaceae bacterium]|nr:methyltransferase domain-containing protein [Puniceicoccaceae bacterium]